MHSRLMARGSFLGSDDVVEVLVLVGKAAAAPFRGYNSGITSVALSRDGNRIVSGGDDGMVRVWGRSTAQRRQTHLPGTIAR